MRIALLAVVGDAATSSALFWWQGGFGGGHGNFDLLIFVLGLPWALIPWPEFLPMPDFVWLICLPFLLNSVAVVTITAIIRRRRSTSANSSG